MSQICIQDVFGTVCIPCFLCVCATFMFRISSFLESTSQIQFTLCVPHPSAYESRICRCFTKGHLALDKTHRWRLVRQPSTQMSLPVLSLPIFHCSLRQLHSCSCLLHMPSQITYYAARLWQWEPLTQRERPLEGVLAVP